MGLLAEQSGEPMTFTEQNEVDRRRLQSSAED
jgi:hypothetical protein